MNRPDIDELTLTDVLEECGLSEDQYESALEVMKNKVSIIYKRKPNEKDISPYNTVLLSLSKSNMNIQFVTGIYGMLAYLTSYLCKAEHGMSELMKKASKEATGENMRGKLRKIGNVFLTKRELSTHEAVIRLLSLPMRYSNISVIFIPTGFREERTRMLKPMEILDTMDPDDTDIYCTNFLERYANRPDELENCCYADFATDYKPASEDKEVEPDDIKNYTTSVTSIETEPINNVPVRKSKNNIVLKNNFGEMKKRTFPCVMRYHKGSKLKNPEHYYMTLLQLYLPWRNEDSLKDGWSSYQEKFNSVEPDIKPNIERHDCFYGIYDDDEDMMNSIYHSDDDVDDGIEDINADEFGMLNPDLLDLDTDQEHEPQNLSVPSTSVEDISMSREEFYENCSQLNEGQQHLLNFIMKYAQQLMLNGRNNLPDPDPFHILLTGGAGVGKSFLANCITAYLLKTLKYPAQDYSKQPSVKVTASTGKAATNVNGTTLHSAFLLPVNQPGMKMRTKPSDDSLQKLQNWYEYLTVLLIDEISMTDKDTFDHLNVWLRKIKKVDIDFGAVSMLLIGDFFQLPPAGNQNFIFKKLTLTDAWHHFYIHELTEIVRQSSDPAFAELLNRLREGNQTEEDIQQIKLLEHTDDSGWPKDHVRLYITNDLKNKHDDRCMKRLLEDDSERRMHVFHAKDSKRDSKTGSHKVTINPDLAISKTGGLPHCLKVCIGNTVMLTYNKDQHDKLINGSIGTVVYIQSSVQNGMASGTIYVKFDDPDAGNSHKNARLRGELKQCVPITVYTNKFRYGPNHLWVERKQFPLVLAHALTIHKSQGSTLKYLTGDMDRTTKTGRGKTPINSGQFYTLVSRGTSSNCVKLKNFSENVIKVSDVVKTEMARMRKDCVFSWKHPLLCMTGMKVCLFNIVSWNLHLPHFLSDKYYINLSSVLCFTETHTNNSSSKRIENYNSSWKSIHHPTAPHGLAICFNTDRVLIRREYPTITEIEMLPVLMEIDDEIILLVLVYRPPGGQRDVFVYQLYQQLTMLDDVERYRTILLGDFNTDQFLQENVDAYHQLCQRYGFIQRCAYSTHIQGGILDLVFDNKKSDSVEWMPSPFSDHFVIIFEA